MMVMFDGFNCRIQEFNVQCLRKLKLGFAKSQISLIFAFVNYNLIWISVQK